MNKKCGNCKWRSDKCKNPENIHYNEFRDVNDRCSIKIDKVHLYWFDYDKDIPGYIDKEDRKMAICGYLRKNITSNKAEVTCKHCLKEIEKLKTAE